MKKNQKKFSILSIITAITILIAPNSFTFAESSGKVNSSNLDIIKKEINGKKYYIVNPSILVIKNILTDISNYNTNFTDISESTSKDDIIKLEAAKVVKGTTPTTYEPNRSITRAEFLAIIMGAYGYDLEKEPKELPFHDVTTPWQKRVVSIALENGIISGDEDHSGNKIFRPNSQISKIEAYAILSNISDISLAKDSYQKHSFIDSAASWQDDIIMEAEYLELVKIPEDKKFYPNLGLSRGDMATLMINYAKLY